MTGGLQRFRLDDRVVVITGASSGLGEAAAREMAAAGADLVLAARRADRLETVADELRAAGTKVLVTPCDVVSAEDCEATAKAAADQFGRIDVLVNNAGIGPAGAALREDPSVFRATIDINLTGAYLMARACAPHMPAGSSIVNVASVLGVVASRFPQAGYVASKAGLLGLTRDLAQQWTGRRGIRVNALCPGYFDSDITGGEGAQRLREMVEAHSIVGRFAAIEEITAALLFLAAPASSYMTGTSLTVDGGLSAMV
jgi:NAD(P)-dependent dehydrogenase (short-subunit alcohol dehydrogenase family)